MHPKDADSIANSEDPDQTAPLGAVLSGSAQLGQTNLSKNLGSLRYILSHVMRKPFLEFPTVSDTKGPLGPQKMARGLKFRIKGQPRL